MKRRIARIGPSTLMVSLPSKWCKERNLHKGDEIEVSPGEDNSLVIGANPPEKKLKEITLDLSKFRYYPRYLVSAAYKIGYDQVIAKYVSEQEREDVEETLNYTCLGYLILEEAKGTLKIKDVAQIEEGEFDSMFRKVFLLTKEIVREGLEFIEKGDFKILKELLLQRRNFHRYTDFCRRALSKRGRASYYVGSISMILQFLMILTRDYRDLCLILSHLPRTHQPFYHDWHVSKKQPRLHLTPLQLDLLKRINQQIYCLVTLIQRQDLEEIDRYNSANISLVEELELMIRRSKKGNDALILSYFFLLLNSIREIREPLIVLSVGKSQTQ